ncbi:unnamed protein product [Aphanomyces euteiches]|uniref:RCK N-terminal domain-containing protein n=1 Tax=Aphanomyces euteiches TaxID=100861 RepID=A0A6G0XBB4_9STRA|nr:hypothetical protein Ae201684_006546 [Aphanomyces euteiches]KAH9090727.1 hypothetical protein Ae201684P_006133 [Aphanomyces euteiches]KAH9157592.1 hypothetical protein AeRB84_000591 [Aphanomyces euteiches]
MVRYSTARLLYKIDTFISTKKGQTVMLVSFGLFLMTVSGLFFSLLPHGTHIEVEAETDLGIEEGSGSGSTSDTLRSLVAFSQVETTPTPADSTSSSSGSSTEGETHSSEHASIIASIWECWLFISDPGAQGEQVEWNKRIFAFFVSVIGMMYFFVIIGFVVDSIRDKMEDLKKGRSNVIEKNHSLLLGWSDKSVALIKQLCLANESEGGGIIVILADMEKEHIETELESQIDEHEYHKTKVVVRSGSPLLVSDLKKVSAHTARSITIMATSMDADKSDAACLRIILGLRGLFQLQGHVVAEVRDIDNEPLVHLVGGSIVETLVSHDIIGRLILLSARSPGLSRVYNSVLGFDGDEFYCKAWPEVVGVAFRDLIPRFPAAAPIGVKTAKGKVVIKPALDYIIQPGDEIIVLAEDNDTYKAEEPVVIPPVAIPAVAPKDKVKEKILVCGWRRDVQDMLVLLDNFLEPGSEVHLVNDLTMDEREEFLTQGGVDMERFENCSFLHFVGNTSVRRYLEPLPLETYTSIMVLCDFQRELDVLNSDSHSLATVLLVRSLQKQRKYKLKESLFGPRICTAIDRWTRHASNKCPCITEILDPRTQKTVVANSTISGHSDFVMSNELISCMLAMISESREVKQILSKLLSPHSNTFMVQPSSRYLTSPTEILSYFQMSMRVLHANELLVGYISKRDKNAPAVLNPKDKTKPIRWRNLDLIVIAGGSALGDRTTDIKRAVVEQIEDSVRRNRGSILARQMSVDDKTVGVVASNPIEAFATTRKSVTYRVLVKPGPGGHKMPKFDADIQLTPEVRHKLMRLNDEVQRFLAKYSSALTES